MIDKLNYEHKIEREHKTYTLSNRDRAVTLTIKKNLFKTVYIVEADTTIQFKNEDEAVKFINDYLDPYNQVVNELSDTFPELLPETTLNNNTISYDIAHNQLTIERNLTYVQDYLPPTKENIIYLEKELEKKLKNHNLDNVLKKIKPYYTNIQYTQDTITIPLPSRTIKFVPNTLSLTSKNYPVSITTNLNYDNPLQQIYDLNQLILKGELLCVKLIKLSEKYDLPLNLEDNTYTLTIDKPYTITTRFKDTLYIIINNETFTLDRAIKYLELKAHENISKLVYQVFKYDKSYIDNNECVHSKGNIKLLISPHIKRMTLINPNLVKPNHITKLDYQELTKNTIRQVFKQEQQKFDKEKELLNTCFTTLKDLGYNPTKHKHTIKTKHFNIKLIYTNDYTYQYKGKTTHYFKTIKELKSYLTKSI